MARAVRRGRLTDSYIESLTKPGFHRDGVLPGFGVRIGRRRKSFEVRIERKAREKVFQTLGAWPAMRVDEARAQAHDILARYERRETVKLPRQGEATIATLWPLYEKWLKDDGKSEATLAGYRGAYKRLSDDTKYRPLAELADDPTIMGDEQDRIREKLMVASTEGTYWNPVAYHLNNACEATAGSLDAWAVGVSVAVEAVASLVSVEGDVEKAKRVGVLQDRMRKWFEEQSDLQDFAKRVKGQIDAMGNKRARDTLHALAATGHVEEDYIKAWAYLRNRHVHPTIKDLEKPGQVDYQNLIDHIHRVEVLLRQLTFHLIGYEGPFTDYGVHGDQAFPSKQYPMKVAQVPQPPNSDMQQESGVVIRRRMSLQQLQRGFDSLPSAVRENGQTESLALASGVLRAFMDAEWVERHIVSDGRKKGFLSIDESDPNRREMSFFRVMDLAEVIYNLQPVPGFDECITRMRDGDIEGTYAELDFGRMLYLNQVPFRFVVPRGATGCDYDIEVEYPDGVIATADAKCKIESTDFSKNTIINTLKKARKQLPDDRPGIVFVKVPPRWIADPASTAAMLEVARSFLRGTRRVVSVKYYSSPITFSNNMLRHDHAYKEISNPLTDFGDNADWSIFKKFILPPEMNGMPPHWRRIIFFPDGKPR